MKNNSGRKVKVTKEAQSFALWNFEPLILRG